MLTGNEILLVMRRYRLRYLMALWPMTATLLIGWGVWRARGRWRLVAGSLTGVCIFGLWANTASELRYEFYEFLANSAVHLVSIGKWKRMQAQFDLLLINDQLYQTADPFPGY